MTLLVLNSMYWTSNTWRPDDYFQERAEKQINWIEEQLQLAKSTDKKVILTSHIPPG
jgi:Tat protein secretion system quality control protein TatD with DNase activity